MGCGTQIKIQDGGVSYIVLHFIIPTPIIKVFQNGGPMNAEILMCMQIILEWSHQSPQEVLQVKYKDNLVSLGGVGETHIIFFLWLRPILGQHKHIWMIPEEGHMKTDTPGWHTSFYASKTVEIIKILLFAQLWHKVWKGWSDYRQTESEYSIKETKW